MGLDVGTARTKIALGRATGPDPPRVHVVPTALASTRRGGRSGDGAYAVAEDPDAVLHDGPAIREPGDPTLLRRFLEGVLSGPDAVVAADPRATSLVIAVPDAWLSAAHADRLRRLLLAELGFASVQLVSEMLCVAARAAEMNGFPPRVGLLCDVGVGSVTAAACAFDGAAVRLLDVESTLLPTHESPDTVLLDGLAAGSPAARGPLARALHDERRLHDHRAQLVLDQARRHPEYRGTPVYFLPGGLTVTAEMLLAALAGVAGQAGDVVDRLRGRTDVSPAVDVVITGGSVFPPVVDRVRQAARAHSTVSLDPTGAACGAQRIAAGRVAAADGYPHVLGLAVRRIRHGLLESAMVEIAGTAAAERSVRLVVEPEEDLAVAWKPDGRGDWESLRPVKHVHVPPGTYRVEARTRRTGAATLLLHGERSTGPITLELPATASGPADG